MNDINGIFILNFNSDENMDDTLDNRAFSNIQLIEPKNDLYIPPSIVVNNQSQSETNDTSKEKEIIDIINNNPKIEMICPFVGRKRLRKILRFKKKRISKKDNKDLFC